MKAGQRSYIPGIGYIAILRVEPVEIACLTDADALPDGFETAVALQHELQTLYADEIAKGFRAFRVCFSVFPPQDQERMREVKRRAKAEIAARNGKSSDPKKQAFVDSALDKLRQMASVAEDDA